MLNSQTGKKVLVVEDEEHNWLLIKEFLELYAIDSIWVESGFEALEILNSHKDIDMILLDMKLPLMTGYEIAPKIKSLYPEICIIAQTAHAQPEDEERCYTCGCDGYIAKTFTLNELSDVIEKTLKRKFCVNDSLSA